MSALSGLRIVDFSRFLPGAYVSWIAADLGADVVRIEHPRELAKRAAMLGPKDAETRARSSYSRNKRSLRINPGHPASQDVLLALIAHADILIEDFRPGVMKAMGLGPEAMLAHNPRLIYCSVSFAGHVGPLSQSVGHDPAALGLAGVLSRLNGLPTPSLPGLQVADVLAGAHATIATLAALQARSQTGKGQHVDVAMTDTALPLLMVTLERTADPTTLPPPDGAWHPKGGVWECADGAFLVTTDMEPAYWARFCQVIGHPEFEALRTRPDEHEEMGEVLAALFRTRPRDSWVAMLREAGSQVAPVHTPAEALAEPHFRARGTVVDVPVDGATSTQIGLPFRLSGTPAVPPRAAAAAGAETQDILIELGLSVDDIAALERSGAFLEKSE